MGKTRKDRKDTENNRPKKQRREFARKRKKNQHFGRNRLSEDFLEDLYDLGE